MDIRAGQNCSNEKSQSKPESQGNLFIHFEGVLTLGAEAREGGKLSLLCDQCKCQLDLPSRDNSKFIENAHYDQNGQFLGSADKNTYFHRNACWRNRVILLPGTYFPIVNRPFSTRRSCTLKGLAHLWVFRAQIVIKTLWHLADSNALNVLQNQMPTKIWTINYILLGPFPAERALVVFVSCEPFENWLTTREKYY